MALHPSCQSFPCGLQVREARDVTRDAAVAVAELQGYVAEGGQQGGWQAHCAHVLGTAAPPGMCLMQLHSL